MIQRLGIIVRDASSSILRQQAWVTISKRVMQKLPAVPYSLFEDNTFQAHYGLVIREASHRSITLVDTLLSTGPILLGLVGLAATLFLIAPLMVLALIAIAFPAALIERQFSNALYHLQEHTAPAQLRLEALTNMQVDALWQRDIRSTRPTCSPGNMAPWQMPIWPNSNRSPGGSWACAARQWLCRSSAWG